MTTDDNDLRNQLATAIWSVHRDNLREAILDGVERILEAECRRREGEAQITVLQNAYIDQGEIFVKFKGGFAEQYIRIAELKATIRGEETDDTP
jgi:hypothetical protein